VTLDSAEYDGAEYDGAEGTGTEVQQAQRADYLA
jgi:hypothetical protein